MTQPSTRTLKKVLAAVVASAMLAALPGAGHAAAVVVGTAYSGAGAAGALGAVGARAGTSLMQQTPALGLTLGGPGQGALPSVAGIGVRPELPLPPSLVLSPSLVQPAAAAAAAEPVKPPAPVAQISVAAPAARGSAAAPLAVVAQAPATLPAARTAQAQTVQGPRFREPQRSVDSVRDAVSGMAAPLAHGLGGDMRAASAAAGLFDNSRAGADAAVLAPEIAADIRKAAKSGYLVRVLRREEPGGRQRVIVLLGEVHYKNKGASQAGQDLLSHFDYIGTELANEGQDLLSRVFIKGLVVPLGKVVGLLSHVGLKVQTSTILDAITRIWQLRQGPSGEPLTRERIRAYLKDQPRFFSEPTRRPDGTPLPKLVLLEEGHTPDALENITKLQVLAPIALAILKPILMLIPGLPPLLAAVEAASAPFSMYVIGSLLLYPRFGQEAWFKYLFPGTVGLLDGRNRTMVRNIGRALRDYQDIDKMLVVFGMAHLFGLRKLLIEREGFQEVPLEELGPRA